jgi:hypothetical protein
MLTVHHERVLNHGKKKLTYYMLKDPKLSGMNSEMKSVCYSNS